MSRSRLTGMDPLRHSYSKEGPGIVVLGRKTCSLLVPRGVSLEMRCKLRKAPDEVPAQRYPVGSVLWIVRRKGRVGPS